MPFTRAPICATAPLGEKDFYQSAGGNVTVEPPSAIVLSSELRNAAMLGASVLTRATLAPATRRRLTVVPRPRHTTERSKRTDPGITNSDSSCSPLP